MRKTSMKNEKIYYIYQSPFNKELIDFQMCGITYPDKNYSISRPKSKIACIEYVEKGYGTINTNEKNIHVGKGDAYFLQKGQSHNYYSDSEEPWKKYFINVTGNLFDKLTEGYKLNGHIYYPNLNIKNELTEIINLSKNQTQDNTEKIIFIITTIFHKMAESLKRKNNKNQSAEKMRSFLDMKITEEFNLSQLCNYMFLSESQVIRIFKNEFGITPYAYFMEKKHNFAKNMLLNTNLSIKQIASELHYTDEYYFSNVFKKKEHISPKSFRNQHFF